MGSTLHAVILPGKTIYYEIDPETKEVISSWQEETCPCPVCNCDLPDNPFAGREHDRRKSNKG